YPVSYLERALPTKSPLLVAAGSIWQTGANRRGVYCTHPMPVKLRANRVHQGATGLNTVALLVDQHGIPNASCGRVWHKRERGSAASVTDQERRRPLHGQLQTLCSNCERDHASSPTRATSGAQ